MIINGINYKVIDVYDTSVTVPDSFVVNDNKTCKGNGEAKLYMGTKEHMRDFYAGDIHNTGFEVECVVLKNDLIQYMQTISHEYKNPSIKYRGQGTRKNMQYLWEQRNTYIQSLPDVLKFTIKDQDQIESPASPPAAALSQFCASLPYLCGKQKQDKT